MAPQRSIELGSVLVIGGCGFLGTHIVDHLLNFPSENSTNEASHITDANGQPDKRFSYPHLRGRYPVYKNTKVSVADLRTSNNRLPGADYYDADVLSVDSLLEVFRAVKPDVVIDTVSLMLEGNHELIYNVNVNGTRNLLEVAGGRKGDWGGNCKAFIYTSSSSVVHDTTSDLIHVDERWPKITGKLQQEYYTETKAIAEDMVLECNGFYPNGMLTVAIRPAGIYGERDTTLTFKMVEHAAKSSQRILNFQLGDNNNLFDFTYVGNIAYSHMLAAELLLATKKRIDADAARPLDYERVDGEAFNITNDSPVYFWDMARAIWALMDRYVEPHQVFALGESTLTIVGGILEAAFGLFGKTPRLRRREVRYSCMTRYYSCDKAKIRLGYEPIVPLDEGVARSVAYVLQKDSNLRAKKQL
ncbi:erg26, C-3 sterol dehydrogenase [Ophidiomyces ophidiicola]|uniref:Erg26, C-3 sterol dehydrogenase n=1 Tax=Ophidiomyces ophidiicola TaxID=1387563 RepID=A0ACB8URW1_9EURO|nr:erg26, C-3 sterol dehydrogenase [Ophidiomyces ophidiicola]KAI1917077.1 erg26, C-3 sterol dehydrogenase [Ophidiomyces ophidiicola]KAI1922626.1 erg26, C-3 sterol dehydrogenase [Ophidiomyces ophidiicola]KAI1927666.1 erg26, C-3 sterol dehydrogenase [Ophidiomyces ophidiicola]KAI1946393.1 erg26, C-3 sterol dehydrogenase [Ophidiomyces ophidiicola]KAI1949969.1 erg26, C-3 sterol dehydrogenase [Ophidiomyces ophidiicola]